MHPHRTANSVAGRTMSALLIVGVVATMTCSSAFAASKTSHVTLEGQLLRPSQVPKPWKSVPTVSSSGIGCLHSLLEPTGARESASASVQYDASSGAPAVSEKLVDYSAAAPAVYRRVTTAVKSCKHVSGTEAGHKVSGTVSPMKLAKYGDQSSAYLVHLKISSTTLSEAVIVVRKGKTLMGFAEVNVGAPPIAQFKSLLTRAVGDLA